MYPWQCFYINNKKNVTLISEIHLSDQVYCARAPFVIFPSINVITESSEHTVVLSLKFLSRYSVTKILLKILVITYGELRA